MALWSRQKIHTIIKYNFVKDLIIDEYSNKLKTILDNDCPRQATIFSLIS